MNDELLNNYLDYSPFYAGFDVEKDFVRRDFLNKYAKLPQALKDFLVSDNTAVQIYNLGSSRGLNRSQIIIMSAIIRYVLVGDIYIKEMPKLLISSIAVGEQEANRLFDSLVNQILPPVWEDVKKIQIQKFGAGQIPQSSSTQLAPSSPSLHEQNMAQPNVQPRPKYPGEDLPETGGNIINLRTQK